MSDQTIIRIVTMIAYFGTAIFTIVNYVDEVRSGRTWDAAALLAIAMECTFVAIIIFITDLWRRSLAPEE